MTALLRMTCKMGLMLLAVLAATASANAQCMGNSAIDSCLAGAWRQSGGGAVEWMKRNMPPGMPVPQIDHSGQVMAFNKDGTYWTAPLAGETKVRIESDGSIRAQGNMTIRASGRWSAQDGKLSLCPEKESFEGQMQMIGPGGAQHTMPMPTPASQPMSVSYTCSDDGLETSMAVPGISDPMVTQFARTGG